MKVIALIMYCFSALVFSVAGQNASMPENTVSYIQESSAFKLVPNSSTVATPTVTLILNSEATTSKSSSSNLLSVSVSALVTSESFSEGLASSASPTITVQKAESTDQHRSTEITQTMQNETYSDSHFHSVSLSNDGTTSFPESNSTSFEKTAELTQTSVNSSSRNVIEYTSAIQENITVTQVASIMPNTVVNTASNAPTNDLDHELFSNITSHINIRETSLQELTTSEAQTVMPNSLVSRTSAIQILDSLTKELHTVSEDSSVDLYTSSLESTSISLSSAVRHSTLTTSATSTEINAFVESVYKLANLPSSSSISVTSFQPFTVTSLNGSNGNSSYIVPDGITASDLPTLSTLSLFNTSEIIGSTSQVNETELIFEPSKTEKVNVSDTVKTIRDFEHLYTSDLAASQTVLYLTTEQRTNSLLYPSSDIGTNDVTSILSTSLTPSLESLMPSDSANLPSFVSSESYVSTVSSIIQIAPIPDSFSETLTRSRQSETSSATTTSEITTSATTTSTTTDSVLLTEKHVTTSIPSSAGNITVSDTGKKPKIYRVMFTFDGDCERLRKNGVLAMEFWTAFLDIMISTTKLESYNLHAERILCDPMRISLRIQLLNESVAINISQIFEIINRKIDSSALFVPIIEDMHVLNFTATSFEIVDVIPGNGLEVAKTALGMVDIVIISIASFLFLVLVLMMIIVLCRECYVRKRTTTFHLNDVPHVNLKLSDFTLTRIPRPQMFYRENSFRKPGPVPVSKLRNVQNGHSETNSKDKMKVKRDNIRVRMSKHEDGLVVGITCSNPPSPKNDSSSGSSSPSNGDQTKTSLLKGDNKKISDGVSNPNYSADDELNGNTKLIIQEDENEQLL